MSASGVPPFTQPLCPKNSVLFMGCHAQARGTAGHQCQSRSTREALLEEIGSQINEGEHGLGGSQSFLPPHL